MQVASSPISRPSFFFSLYVGRFHHLILDPPYLFIGCFHRSVPNHLSFYVGHLCCSTPNPLFLFVHVAFIIQFQTFFKFFYM